MTSNASIPFSAQRNDLRRVQRRRKLAIACITLLVLCALPLMQSLARVEMFTHESVEIGGIVLILIAIFGRAWCTLYIGGRKARQLTDTGPYSISRNPLYMFSFIGATGIGAQTGSLLVATLFGVGAFAVFLPVILREERALGEMFGASFSEYKARVPRFGPRFAVWQDADMLEVRPQLLVRTLRDGLVFLMVIPIFELIDRAQVIGLINPMVYLP
ncbi:isoprenylcysteine carboxylmethyltransferase family protein [Thalassospira sp.]|uniref:methyltransferase family protein n=1 Tax=Thalassospira sp. TaxID=1912094 RepID=UPI000C61641C|nr:isoprenylcysteine carboxylmethyltransferase family protein [Thalassospira sp.]MBC06774.1 isoprenylcysteine carboxyl methyltransferase [Thalassospira sp.]|tara:strand:+ start:18458 stop:19105 length:648 start_codon:yes stop_codon:yes gene_type:complete